MKKSKLRSGTSIQRNSRATVSSLWNSSYSQSYQSTTTFHDSTTENIIQSKSSTLRSLMKSNGHSRSGSVVRNSSFALEARCCMACYESKIIAVDPVVFMVMFAVYLQKIVFELYSFNYYAKIKTNHYPLNRDVCYRTSVLSNSSLVERDYKYYGQWDNQIGDVVEEETGLLFMTVGMVSGVLSIFGTFLLGPFSNFFGRKGALVSLTAGMVLQAIFTTIIIGCELDLHFFVLAFAFRALTGNVAGMYVISYSYIAEVCKNLKKKWHSWRIGFVETLSFIAVSSGFLIGGMSIHKLNCNFMIPSYLSLAVMLAAFIYALVATPERYDDIYASSTTSKHSPSPSPAPLLCTDPKSMLRGMRMMVRKKSPHFTMWLSLVVMMVTVMNSTGMSAIITLFLLNNPLSWFPNLIGVYLGVTEFVRGLVLVVVLPWLLSNGIHDITIVSLSMLLTISMNVALGFVMKHWQLLVVGIGLSGEVLVVPTLKAIMSKSVDPEEKNALFSFLSVAQLLSSVLGYAVYVPIYVANWKYSHPRSVSFFVMAAVYLAMLPPLCALGIMKEIKRRKGRRHTLLNAVTDDITSTNADESVAPPISSVGLASSLLPDQQSQVNVAECGVDGKNGTNHGTSRPLRSSLEASVGQDVVQETFGESSWMLHSYSSMSEYHASR